MPRGGTRPGAGRKPGAPNKRTRAIALEAAATGLSPVAVLLFWMNAAHVAGDGPAAVDAATRAAPFIHPRLSAIALDMKDVSDEELRRLAE
jgi:hypothetical protein